MTILNPIKDFDVIVLGGGAAGISSALWCDELGLKTLILEENDELGGQLLRVYNPIRNHLGASAENGRELRDIFVKQIENCGFSVKLSSAISEIDVENKAVRLVGGEKLSAAILVIAAGVSRRKLKVAGEDKFKNKGIIESGQRDRHLIENQKAVVIGGGDAAFENALMLAETASKVTLIQRRAAFRARPEFVEKVGRDSKIEILTDSTVREFIGAERVEAVEIHNSQFDKTQILPVEAVLIRIGVEPNTRFLRGKIEMDENGYIKVNQNCETNISGIFAVGDVANPLAPTVSTAVGMGATAAKVIFDQLNA